MLQFAEENQTKNNKHEVEVIKAHQQQKTNAILLTITVNERGTQRKNKCSQKVSPKTGHVWRSVTITNSDGRKTVVVIRLLDY